MRRPPVERARAGAAPRLVLLALALWGPGAPADAVVFDAWLAVCRPQGAGYCTASTVRRGVDGARVDWRLRVLLPGFFAPRALSLVSVRDLPARGGPIELSVDGGPPYRFAAGGGWRAIGAVNDHYLLDATQVEPLLAALRGGASVEVRYVDSDGRRQRPRFDLHGLGAALDHLAAAQAALLPGFAGDPLAGWTGALHDLLDVINACLRQAPSTPAVAYDAAPVHDALARVRTLDEGGRRFTCVADRGTLEVRRLEAEPAGTAAAAPGPWYLPADQRPPADACAGQLPLVDVADRPAGWLLYGC